MTNVEKTPSIPPTNPEGMRFTGTFTGFPGFTRAALSTSGRAKSKFYQFRLRHSLVQLHPCSRVSFQPGGALYDGNGIQPDVLIEPTPEDLLGKTDSVPEAACRKLQTAPERE